MPWGLKRYQEARCLHFVTFSCYARAPRLATPPARDVFEKTFEDTRQWYGFYIAGYVVMPEHVHLLLTEPERTKLSIALQMLKQNVAQAGGPPLAIFACTIPAEGAPSLRFLQGWVAMLPTQLFCTSPFRTRSCPACRWSRCPIPPPPASYPPSLLFSISG